MSRARAHSDRIDRDAYYTPDKLAFALVKELPIQADALVLEPHAGGGAFVRALCSKTMKVQAMDIDPEAPGLSHPRVCSRVADFLEYIPERHEIPEWIVGNPPYREAEAHIRHALGLARNVAFLLRLGFLESSRRLPFWAEHPPSEVYVLAQRPSFTKGATDSTAYGWFVWRDGRAGPTLLHILDWKNSRGGAHGIKNHN